MTHLNSRRARREDRAKLGKQAARVLEFLRRTDRPLTDREVARDMGYGSDRSKTQPRVSDLVKLGLVEEVGSCVCKQSGKRVRVVAAVSEDLLGVRE